MLFIYLTHICGLLTVLAWIDWQFPYLAFYSEVIILLSLMLMEWTAANLPLSIKQGIKKKSRNESFLAIGQSTNVVLGIWV